MIFYELFWPEIKKIKTNKRLRSRSRVFCGFIVGFIYLHLKWFQKLNRLMILAKVYSKFKSIVPAMRVHSLSFPIDFYLVCS